MDNHDGIFAGTMLRVAFVAHELSPYQGSECAGGWKLLLQLVERHSDLEIDVFCADGPQQAAGKYADDIKQWEQLNPKLTRVRFMHVHYGPLTHKLISANFSRRKFKAGVGNPLLYFLAYRTWQRRAMMAVHKRNQDHPYDLLHIVNLITLREPGLWRNSEIPLIWGPTGGVSSAPWSFLRSLPIAVQAQELVRQLSWALPTFRKWKVLRTIRRAKHVFFFDRREAQLLGVAGKASILADSACGPVSVIPKPETAVLHVVVVGQLVERKMPRLVLRALAELSADQRRIQVSYVGNGPLEDELKAMTTQMGLNMVRFKGSLAHDAMKDLYLSADILVHPSFREAGSHVVPEALSAGLPVICHAVGGLDYFVDESCGILIPLVDEETSISAIANALESLSNDRDELARLSQGAIARASKLGWATMADHVASIYKKVASEESR
ncbi:glycosyltransferase [Nostoc sp. CHAB 5824]|nr:glycosyltransferase [Nostoc sp. CHAB 5824]